MAPKPHATFRTASTRAREFDALNPGGRIVLIATQGAAIYKARLKACESGSACGCGRRCARARPSLSPKLARRWARSGSIRRSPPAPRLASERR